jgi:hypothetical protein
MGERVVEVVVVRRVRLPSAGAPKKPELLEVADVREIPDERRLEWRELTYKLLVVERLQQVFGPLSCVLENRSELSR